MYVCCMYMSTFFSLSLSLSLCVCVCVCVCMCVGVHCTGMQRSDVDVWSLSQFFSTLTLETDSLAELEAHQIWLELLSSKPQDPPASAPTALDFQECTVTSSSSLMGFWMMDPRYAVQQAHPSPLSHLRHLLLFNSTLAAYSFLPFSQALTITTSTSIFYVFVGSFSLDTQFC